MKLKEIKGTLSVRSPLPAFMSVSLVADKLSISGEFAVDNNMFIGIQAAYLSLRDVHIPSLTFAMKPVLVYIQSCRIQSITGINASQLRRI